MPFPLAARCGHSAFPASHSAVAAINFFLRLAEELCQRHDSVACDSVACTWFIMCVVIKLDKQDLTESRAAGPIGLIGIMIATTFD